MCHLTKTNKFRFKTNCTSCEEFFICLIFRLRPILKPQKTELLGHQYGKLSSPCKNEGNGSCLEIWCLVFQSLNSWKPRVLLEMCLKIAGFFLQLCKVSWKACVWIFLENPFFSQLSKSCERLVFGDFVENRWFFTTLQSLVKSSCLEIFLKLSLAFRSWAM